MSTQRKLIRAALRTLLLNETDADERVFPNRIRSLWQDEVPAIIIRTESEDVDIEAVAPIEYERKLHVEIEILATADDACDDTLDILGAQVEARMSYDHTLGERCHDVVLTGSEFTSTKEGDNVYASLVLRYDVIYHSYPARDSEDLEWLNRVDVEYELTDAISGTENATDTITGLGE